MSSSTEEIGDPFPIHTDTEREYYEEFSGRLLAKPRYINMERLQRQAASYPNSYEATLLAWIERLGCLYLAEQRIPSYRRLIEEFYTTHDEAIAGGNFRCRLNGMEINVTKEMLSAILGFDCSIHEEPDRHKSYKESKFRRKLSKRNPGTKGRMEATRIADDALFTVYKFLAGVVLGKSESTKIAKEELYILWCLTHGKPTHLYPLILTTIKNVHRLGRDKPAHLTFGPLITLLARHNGIDTEGLGLEAIPPMAVTITRKNPELVIIYRVPILRGAREEERNDVDNEMNVDEQERADEDVNEEVKIGDEDVEGFIDPFSNEGPRHNKRSRMEMGGASSSQTTPGFDKGGEDHFLYRMEALLNTAQRDTDIKMKDWIDWNKDLLAEHEARAIEREAQARTRQEEMIAQMEERAQARQDKANADIMTAIGGLGVRLDEIWDVTRDLQAKWNFAHPGETSTNMPNPENPDDNIPG